MADFGSNVRDARLRARYSQRELGQKLGVTHVAVYRWESGSAMPDLRRIPKLARVLDCKVEDLFRGIEDEPV